jgi:hypothetical protein
MNNLDLILTLFFCYFTKYTYGMVRPPGFEPGPSAWQAEIIPLDNGRTHNHYTTRLI